MPRTPTLHTDRPSGPVATHEVRGGGGLALDVREWGDPQGPPVVLIHGWSQCQLCWSRQVTGPLAAELRIVTFDLRGHGGSAQPLDAGSYTDAGLWADDLAAVIEHLGLDRPVLVGWSYGGFVATDYLRAYGADGIAGLNLVGGAVLRTAAFDHIGPGLLDNAAAACDPDLSVAVPAIARFLRACTARELDAGDRDLALSWNAVVAPQVRGALLAREIDGDVVLSGLSVPVLVSHGRRDTIVLPSMAEHVLDVCPTARASWYDDAGHMPFLEDPQRFDDELRAFVGVGAPRL